MENSKIDKIPQLENGDLRYQQHGQPHSDIMGGLWVGRAATTGVYANVRKL